MIVLKVRNVHEALPKALELLADVGVRRDSRNGPVIVAPEPVATVYEKPWERVIFHDWRDANPFFHLYESLWMLAGRRDVAPLMRYVKRFGEYSDNGIDMNAAYGFRWRNSRTRWSTDAQDDLPPGLDQLTKIINELKQNKDSRQCVLQIWDSFYDLIGQSKDKACNLTATFQVNHLSKLDMSVFCRSNDIIWGCYGANAVQYSMLHEYVATFAGYPMGTYTQISVNWHAYDRKDKGFTEMLEKSRADALTDYQPYVKDVAATDIRLFDGSTRESWDADVGNAVTAQGWWNREAKFVDHWFLTTVMPLVEAHDLWKEGDKEDAFWMANKIESSDWRRACQEWIQRRLK